MSKVHKVVSGDTLGGIAVKYLGSFSRWKDIVSVNAQLTGRRTASDGSPLIYPDDVLIIPVDELEIKNIPAKKIEVADGEQDVAIVIDGKKFVGFTGYELNLSYDSFDTFSFSAPYNYALKELKNAIMPFLFKKCEIYYNGSLVFTGRLLTPDPKLESGSSEICLQGYPLCGVLNDCSMLPSQFPLQFEGLNIKQIAEKIIEPYKVGVVVRGDVGAEFEDVSCEMTDNVLPFLTKLLKQRNMLFTNDEKGRLVLFSAKEKKAEVSFCEGEAPLLSVSSKFNAQNFYSHITGFTKTGSDKDSLSYTFKNKYLINKGVMRYHSVKIDDAKTQNDLEKAVKAQAGRMFADCVSYDLSCEGHLLFNDVLCKKSLTVCVKAPSAMILRDTNFLARNIKIVRGSDGKHTEMSLVFPSSYSDKVVERLPWE